MNETITTPIFEVTLPKPEISKGEREYQAFLRMLPELLQKYAGKHVAIHEGQVVDVDDDDIALIKRVRMKVGNVPIHVGLVVQPQPISRFTRYREIRPGDGK